MDKDKLKVDIDKDELLNKGKGIFSDFKDFISQGDVLDLAVGVIIGGAFGKIVTSLVNDIIMPLIGVLIGGVDFTGLKANIGQATITYGVFIQNILDFLIVALCIFFFVRGIEKMKKKMEEKFKKEVEDAAEKEEEKKDEQLALLEEIRDLLKNK